MCTAGDWLAAAPPERTAFMSVPLFIRLGCALQASKGLCRSVCVCVCVCPSMCVWGGISPSVKTSKTKTFEEYLVHRDVETESHGG